MLTGKTHTWIEGIRDKKREPRANNPGFRMYSPPRLSGREHQLWETFQARWRMDTSLFSLSGVDVLLGCALICSFNDWELLKTSLTTNPAGKRILFTSFVYSLLPDFLPVFLDFVHKKLRIAIACKRHVCRW